MLPSIYKKNQKLQELKIFMPPSSTHEHSKHMNNLDNLSTSQFLTNSHFSNNIEPRTSLNYNSEIQKTNQILEDLNQNSSKKTTKFNGFKRYNHHRVNSKRCVTQMGGKVIFEDVVDLSSPQKRILNSKRATNQFNKQIKIITDRYDNSNRSRANSNWLSQIQVIEPEQQLVLEKQLTSLRKLIKNKRKLADQFENEKQKPILSTEQIKKYRFERMQTLFAYETAYFIQLKNQLWNQKAEKLLEKNGHQTSKAKNNPGQNEEVYTIHFPSLSEIDKVIRNYKPLSQNFNIQLVIREGEKYFLEYKDNEKEKYLYFGEHDSLNKRAGLGVLVLPNKLFQGLWENGQIVKGVEMQKKFIYEGEFYKYKKHGQGVSKSLSGQYYKGGWINNKRHGYGHWTSQNNQSYIGDWVAGKAQGFGAFQTPEGDKYSGQFKAFMKTGKGKEYFANGDFYQGQFFEGKPHGRGKYIWQNGMIYEGKFKHGARQGYGRLQMPQLFQFKGRFQGEKPLVNQQNAKIIQKSISPLKGNESYKMTPITHKIQQSLRGSKSSKYRLLFQQKQTGFKRRNTQI